LHCHVDSSHCATQEWRKPRCDRLEQQIVHQPAPKRYDRPEQRADGEDRDRDLGEVGERKTRHQPLRETAGEDGSDRPDQRSCERQGPVALLLAQHGRDHECIGQPEPRRTGRRPSEFDADNGCAEIGQQQNKRRREARARSVGTRRALRRRRRK
jgi:hypothetical protein